MFVLKCMAGSVLVLLFLIGVLLVSVRKFKSDLLVCLASLNCSSLWFACSCFLSKFASLCLLASNISVTSVSTASIAFSLSCLVSIFVSLGVIDGIGKGSLFLINLSSFSIVNNFITSSTSRRMSEMYGPYTLQAVTALSCDSVDFLFSSTEISAYSFHSWQYWQILCSTSSKSMISAGAAIFFTKGILSSFSSRIELVSMSLCSSAVKSSRSNGSCWHQTPMSSWGLRYVNTCPVLRSNSKVDVWKYSLSGGHLNSILPCVVSTGILSLINSPAQVL